MEGGLDSSLYGLVGPTLCTASAADTPADLAMDPPRQCEGGVVLDAVPRIADHKGGRVREPRQRCVGYRLEGREGTNASPFRTRTGTRTGSRAVFPLATTSVGKPWGSFGPKRDFG
jgi:hypothetical protein